MKRKKFLKKIPVSRKTRSKKKKDKIQSQGKPENKKIK